MGIRFSHSWLLLPAAGTTALAILTAVIIVVMNWSSMQPQAAAGEPVRFAEAEKQSAPSPAPKKSPPVPKKPPQTQAPKPAQIDRNGVLILIRSTLLALDEANKTGNYTVLRDLGSAEFQVNTAARLAEIFASQRKDNIDLSGVAVIDPQLTLLPQIEANGMMRMAGFFPSVPTQVNFELIYTPVNGRWRLFGLGVSFGQAAPAAPQPPPTASPEGKEPDAQAPPPAEPKSTDRSGQ